MLLSGASAAPRLKLQRSRARIAVRKSRTLAATCPGTSPASTCLEVASGEVVLALEDRRRGPAPAAPAPAPALPPAWRGRRRWPGSAARRGSSSARPGCCDASDRRQAIEEEQRWPRTAPASPTGGCRRASASAKRPACHQRLRLRLGGLAAGRGARRSAAVGGRRHGLLVRRAPGRRGEHETGGDRKSAEEQTGSWHCRRAEERADVQNRLL